MKILFVHQAFPSQFKHLAPALVEQGHEVSALTLRSVNDVAMPRINVLQYKLARSNATNGHPWTVDFESKVIRGEACLRAALELRSKVILRT